MALYVGKEKFATTLVSKGTIDYSKINVDFNDNDTSLIGTWAYKEANERMNLTYSVNNVPASIDTAELYCKVRINSTYFDYTGLLTGKGNGNYWTVGMVNSTQAPYLFQPDNYVEISDSNAKLPIVERDGYNNNYCWIKLSFKKGEGTKLNIQTSRNYTITPRNASPDVFPNEWFNTTPIMLNGIDGSFLYSDGEYGLGFTFESGQENSQFLRGAIDLLAIKIMCNGNIIYRAIG